MWQQLYTPWLEQRIRKVCRKRALGTKKLLGITNYGQIGSYSMTSFARLFNYIIFITIFHGLRLKNIFLGALTGSSGTLFPVCILRIAHLFAAIL
jgi:hypothetical protein